MQKSSEFAIILPVLFMKFEFSAGGVVYKKEDGKTLVLVSQHSQHHGWVFPKGLIGDNIKGEKKEDTALREVTEETGIVGKIQQPLPEVSYWYKFNNKTIKKTVYYFIMHYVSGDTTNHDDEMENVEWLSINEVEKRLTYKSDKQVWQKARELIQ